MLPPVLIGFQTIEVTPPFTTGGSAVRRISPTRKKGGLKFGLALSAFSVGSKRKIVCVPVQPWVASGSRGAVRKSIPTLSQRSYQPITTRVDCQFKGVLVRDQTTRGPP